MTKFRRKQPYFSVAFKKSVIKEMLEFGLSALHSAKRHGVSFRTIYTWLNKYESEITCNFEIDQPTYVMPKKPDKKSLPADPALLKARILELEKELRLEQLKRESYERMIKIAEQRFDITIEKKSGTKPSKK